MPLCGCKFPIIKKFMAQLLKWKETRKTWRSQASRVWPSSLHNKCSNSECNHPNHPQVKEGKYVCDGVATNAFFCQGTYRVSRKRARESADYWRRNTRDDQEYIETVAQIVVRREDTISRRARENAEYINEERGRMEASEEAREFYRKRREQRRRERSSGTQEPRWRQYRQDSTERDLDITPQSSTGRHSNIEGADTSHTPRPTQHAHVVASTAASQSSLITPLFSASAEVTRTTSGESITKSEGIALVTKQANQGLSSFLNPPAQPQSSMRNRPKPATHVDLSYHNKEHQSQSPSTGTDLPRSKRSFESWVFVEHGHSSNPKKELIGIGSGVDTRRGRKSLAVRPLQRTINSNPPPRSATDVPSPAPVVLCKRSASKDKKAWSITAPGFISTPISLIKLKRSRSNNDRNSPTPTTTCDKSDNNLLKGRSERHREEQRCTVPEKSGRLAQRTCQSQADERHNQVRERPHEKTNLMDYMAGTGAYRQFDPNALPTTPPRREAQLPAGADQKVATLPSGGYWAPGPPHRSTSDQSVLTTDPGSLGLKKRRVGESSAPKQHIKMSPQIKSRSISRSISQTSSSNAKLDLDRPLPELPVECVESHYYFPLSPPTPKIQLTVPSRTKSRTGSDSQTPTSVYTLYSPTNVRPDEEEFQEFLLGEIHVELTKPLYSESVSSSSPVSATSPPSHTLPPPPQIQFSTSLPTNPSPSVSSRTAEDAIRACGTNVTLLGTGDTEGSPTPRRPAWASTPLPASSSSLFDHPHLPMKGSRPISLLRASNLTAPSLGPVRSNSDPIGQRNAFAPVRGLKLRAKAGSVGGRPVTSLKERQQEH